MDGGMTTAATLRPALLPRLAEQTAGVVVCVATGPSLTQTDVDYIRGKATVICVNDSHRLAPWADCLYSSDRYWWAFHSGVPTFDGARATIEYSPGRKATELTRLAPDMCFYRHTGFHGVESEPDGLRTCGNNSGGAALNLAVHLGARKVILIGYDMGATQGKRHFFGDHPHGLSNTHNFPTWRKAFEKMTPELQTLGVEVVNSTVVTSLSAFPCAPLRDVL